MPTYEFICQECRTVFAERRPFAEAGAPAVCPACASERTRKVVGAVAVIGGAADNIPLPMSNGHGGCGCGGACSCGGH